MDTEPLKAGNARHRTPQEYFNATENQAHGS